jgi:hypothetical protein
MTLLHFSVSSATSLPKSVAEPTSGCPVSGHDRAIYDAGCSSGVTIGTGTVCGW